MKGMKTLKRSKILKIANLAVLQMQADLHIPYLVLLHKKNVKEHK